MRVVVDTNVIVSAVLKEGSAPEVTMRLVHRYHRLLKSSATEHEIRRVLSSKKLAAAIDPSTFPWLDSILTAAELVTIKQSIKACRDPDDDKFLDVAVNGHAGIIISGDEDLLVIASYQDIPILKPAAFLTAFHS